MRVSNMTHLPLLLPFLSAGIHSLAWCNKSPSQVIAKTNDVFYYNELLGGARFEATSDTSTKASILRWGWCNTSSPNALAEFITLWTICSIPQVPTETQPHMCKDLP